ncbi:hypothetical protein REPUB_Repub02eG0269300 [Reevesia pubescens]
MRRNTVIVVLRKFQLHHLHWVGLYLKMLRLKTAPVLIVVKMQRNPPLDDRKLEKQGSTISEIELMKERFAKLLLGEDMSGCGNGVCTALAISNSITNLCATLFGQIWRLEPVPPKKAIWRREMEWLRSVSDHIVELIPSWQTFPDGRKLEQVMTCRPREDLYINLLALRKLYNMLLVRSTDYQLHGMVFPCIGTMFITNDHIV